MKKVTWCPELENVQKKSPKAKGNSQAYYLTAGRTSSERQLEEIIDDYLLECFQKNKGEFFKPHEKSYAKSYGKPSQI